MPKSSQESITAEQQVEELKDKLGIERDKLEFLEKIVHSMPAILYLFDISEMKMIWCNRRHKEFVGFDTTGMKLLNKKGDLMKICKNDQSIAIDNIQGWRDSGAKPGKVIIRLTDQEGSEKYFYTDHHVYKTDKDDNPVWILGIGVQLSREDHTEHEKRILFSEDISETYRYLDKFSDLELKILKLLSRGRSYQEIADEINLSVDGIRYHIRKIYKIMEVNTRVEAITTAMKYRLIQP